MFENDNLNELITIYYIKMKIIKNIFRNRQTLNRNQKVKKGVQLEWWSFKENVGDCLAPVVVNWILDSNKVNFTKNKKKIHLFTIGSILGLIDCDGVVWGSGIHKISSIVKLSEMRQVIKYDIRAVRGPITKRILEECGQKCPSVFGDPGVLLPLIYDPEVEKVYECSIIRHFSKQDDDIGNYHKIDVKTNDYKQFIREIKKSKRIISSSLHGIILAESYGVPAVFLFDEMGDEIMKFYDWYLSTNRKNIKIAFYIQEAAEMIPMELPKLNDMQNRLLNSFPYDLFN